MTRGSGRNGPDASVDGYRADKAFHELARPERALTEARRSLVPGGRILLVGHDWDTVVIDSADPALARTVLHARADLVAIARAARRNRNLLLNTGFGAAAIEVHTGVFTGSTMRPAKRAAASSSGPADEPRGPTGRGPEVRIVTNHIPHE
ncbi:methyltransferase domain-containing protein [Streptomyces sp. KM273126]|uniref:methyltransferase domain-containing protein n=1 Tax=Streptomyces sp. KM273126 TaxID=2545247 RepID=UPI00103968CD|nr:methyltransferase domain-containing protein [Streptomyces sp. KM273126]MBA2812791.1 methyltransferase domain-containing protein [Streptomyces sp. KM273126]